MSEKIFRISPSFKLSYEIINFIIKNYDDCSLKTVLAGLGMCVEEVINENFLSQDEKLHSVAEFCETLELAINPNSNENGTACHPS